MNAIMLGTIGQFLLLTAFIACGVAGWAYFNATRTGQASQRKLGRIAWTLSIGLTVMASGILLYLILTHQFQYNYVYSYSSKSLPLDYLVSSFWAGQEGSFLLWILCNGVIGMVLLRSTRDFEDPVMAVMSMGQFFLLSMVAGISLGSFSIGSDPFLLLAAKHPDAPMLQAGLIPDDGQGLNDLLQNYWMIIHPPVLFIGFAAMVVPFAYAVAGLWKRQYTAWIQPALPWALFANLALMTGIAMGGYWAYVTLSFGGYWAWDPVENSSLVPWLVGVGALHAMIAHKRSGTNLKAAILLNIVAFILVVYSTFLTRSGILGDFSVHSFVDLGLYNQLLLWILSVAAVGIGLFLARQHELPKRKDEVQLLSREFLIFSGAMVLCALAAVILVGTSAPILGRLFQDNPASPPVAFYNKWSLPLSALLVFLAGMGQLFWWQKMRIDQVNQVLLKPTVLATVCTLGVLFLTPFMDTITGTAAIAAAGTGTVSMGMGGLFGRMGGALGQGLLMLLLVFFAFFALFGNGQVLWRIGRGNPRMAGGAVSHLGFILMVFGIITSSVFNNPISDPTRPAGRDVFVIDEGQTRAVEGYNVTYKGRALNDEGRTEYLLDFRGPDGRQFEVNPVVYKNNRGQWIQNPSTKHFLEKDLYVAVSPRAMYEDPETGGSSSELVLSRGDTVRVADGAYSFVFQGFELNVQDPAVPASADIAVAAVVDVLDVARGEKRTLTPIYYKVDGQDEVFVTAEIPEWEASASIAAMQVDNGLVRLVLKGMDIPSPDWLVVQAYEKPFINLLWAGLLIMLGGFGISIYRRAGDLREKGLS